MSRQVTLDNLWNHSVRSDGRDPNELRSITCNMGIFPQANGSASFTMGNTKVFAAVYGPHEARASQKKQSQCPDKMAVNIEYSSACFASSSRKTSTTADRKSLAGTSKFKSVIENIIVLEIFPGSQVDIYIELIEDDGGSYAAGINAVNLALIDAGIPVRDFVVACTGTLTNGIPMVDINGFERSSGVPELTVGILAQSSQIILLEQSRLLPVIHFQTVLNVALEGCKKIHEIVGRAAKEKFHIISDSLKPFEVEPDN